MYRFRFFFDDMIHKHNKCEDIFLRKVLTHLKFNTFSSGQIIVDVGQRVNHLFLFHQGRYTLTDNSGLFKIVNLGVGSYYGEYQIQYGLRNSFILRASVIENEEIK